MRLLGSTPKENVETKSHDRTCFAPLQVSLFRPVTRGQACARTSALCLPGMAGLCATTAQTRGLTDASTTEWNPCSPTTSYCLWPREQHTATPRCCTHHVRREHSPVPHAPPEPQKRGAPLSGNAAHSCGWHPLCGTAAQPTTGHVRQPRGDAHQGLHAYEPCDRAQQCRPQLF